MEKINNISKIGVISDTHSTHLPDKVKKLFNGVDLIIHAGDHTSQAVINSLEKIAPLVSVRGNMDGAELNLEEQTVLMINNKFKIAVCHGAGVHSTTPERMFKKFAAEIPDVIIFGHTHIPLNKLHAGILLFNPGSPTKGNIFNSVGIITVTNDSFLAEIVKL
ncbi:MAG: metallophosphoesterase [Candidatus Goldbacteria bacterium]|nr:metallophosphoesterase [Candidatus Goldiibacteriota bacterium]